MERSGNSDCSKYEIIEQIGKGSFGKVHKIKRK